MTKEEIAAKRIANKETMRRLLILRERIEEMVNRRNQPRPSQSYRRKLYIKLVVDGEIQTVPLADDGRTFERPEGKSVAISLPLDIEEREHPSTTTTRGRRPGYTFRTA